MKNNFNLPVEFSKDEKILLCGIGGIGGGFDILATIPIFHKLNSMDIDTLFHSYTLLPSISITSNHCVEKYVSEYTNKPVIKVPKIGVVPLRKHYEEVIKSNGITHILIVDGGVDSLMRGDEINRGTIAEEFVNYAALKTIPIKKTLVTWGFGCEVEEKISHYRVLENIALLFRDDGFFGTCTLAKKHEEYIYYKSLYESIFIKNPLHKKSHIHPRIMAAVEGRFGYEQSSGGTIMKGESEVFISPLMATMWWFDLDKVINRNLLIEKLMFDKTFMESISSIDKINKSRDYRPIPY